MSSSVNGRSRCRYLWPALLAFVAAACILCGCATTDESEMPWNSPQPWEGSPSIPGLTPDY